MRRRCGNIQGINIAGGGVKVSGIYKFVKALKRIYNGEIAFSADSFFGAASVVKFNDIIYIVFKRFPRDMFFFKYVVFDLTYVSVNSAAVTAWCFD